MANTIKIVFIGAASVPFRPSLFRDIFPWGKLSGSSLALVDTTSVGNVNAVAEVEGRKSRLTRLLDAIETNRTHWKRRASR